MLLFNEKNQAVDIKDIKSKLRNLKDTPVPTKDEVCTALGEYYNQSLQIQAARLQIKAELSPSAVAKLHKLHFCRTLAVTFLLR